MKKPRLVLKLGSSTLTQGTDQISRGKMEDVARAISLHRDEFDILLVSSGAIAAARQFLRLERNIEMKEKQAMAAIGQVHLMRMYYEIFRDYGISISQCLLSYPDLSNPVSRKNIQNTIQTLLDFSYLPIINENDTVSTEEIKFGDNDKLAAMVAELIRADKLILVTDTGGVYDKDPNLHPDARRIDLLESPESLLAGIEPSRSVQGTGGMRSKLIAACLARENGIETRIISGASSDFLSAALSGRLGHTIVPALTVKRNAE